MNAPPWKRVRHWLIYRTENHHGEWTIHVEPGGLQIDTFHARGEPHVHAPGDYEARLRIAPITARRAASVVYAHLQRNGEIRLQELIEELNDP